jgi:16S rRNA (adenine1518-N6/adenine1519-N6)-dimethyltransferase
MKKTMSSNIKAKRSLGQNFLVNPGVAERIVAAAEIGPDDVVVEVGPGTGNLTKKILEKVKRVIAIEKDSRLIGSLRTEFSDTGVHVIEGDALKIDPSSLGLRDNSYKIVANIPYYITSNFLRIVFEKWPKPKLIVLTIQKEVAQRIVSKAGEMNLLALSVQLYSDPKIMMTVSKGSFRPVPKVDSAVIKLLPHPKADRESIRKALDLAKKAFAGKRKQLKNTLKGLDLAKLGISPEARPEDLDISDWLKLTSEV